MPTKDEHRKRRYLSALTRLVCVSWLIFIGGFDLLAQLNLSQSVQFRDHTHELSIQELLSTGVPPKLSDSRAWLEMLGELNDPLWIKVELPPEAFETGKVLLLDNPSAYQVTCYLGQGGNLIQEWAAGPGCIQHPEYLPGRQFAFPVSQIKQSLQPDSIQCWLKIVAYDQLTFPTSLWNETELRERDDQALLILGLVLTILLISIAGYVFQEYG